MDFPITRKRLQDYMKNEAAYADVRKRVAQEIHTICEKIESIVLTTPDQKYVYTISDAIKYGVTMPSNFCENHIQPVGILKELLNAIALYFPDCAIQIDPLETYIMIDWS